MANGSFGLERKIVFMIYMFSIADKVVYIGAIGEKRGNRFFFAGEVKLDRDPSVRS
jgi:hypothetical protein